MRAGALPAKLTTIEKKLVGAGLGRTRSTRQERLYYGARL